MSKRNQIGFYSLEDLVPQEHLLRDIDKYIDFSFIYQLVEDKYDQSNGRPSLDPVMLIKLPLIQYLYGIKSMRQTIKEVEVNMAYRWFLGLDIQDSIPHFSTFGKNYSRRFKGTDIFEQIFYGILAQCIEAHLVDTSEIFIDRTHIKAHANNKKYESKEITEDTLFYVKSLQKEIEIDREKQLKKPLKRKEESEENRKVKKISKIDADSGWFHKGEHKQVFAYATQVACDKNGCVGYTIHPGNQHDSRTFISIYNKLKSHFTLDKLVMDAGYKTPGIVHLLFQDNLTPVFPYKRPMTKKGFFKKYDYVYDEYYNQYICPNMKTLAYTTTNRDGYREYKSNSYDCMTCSLINKCTQSKDKRKQVQRHLWEDDMVRCENIRHSLGMTSIYNNRKQTIERLFGTAKEFHGLRYTNLIGKEKMHMKIGLTFACLSIKKLAKMLKSRDLEGSIFLSIFNYLPKLIIEYKKDKPITLNE
ncbi:IS1182 family transposase [Vagococcus luciliae]|uniref:IS1182 family transposase ISEnfa2 n=1 Tax=Vagococcus luciliae TaxID=2920380 RepID=A0ABY5NXI0_9ENTE|nr:IS1182 family transposase ISEnfa2 [Vagococcus luciliae]